jgi:hypothetical protein
MFPEKHKAITVNFDGTPGMGLHQSENIFPAVRVTSGNNRNVQDRQAARKTQFF